MAKTSSKESRLVYISQKSIFNSILSKLKARIRVPELYKKTYTCIICMNDLQEEKVARSSTDSCGHSICQICAREYFNSALKDERYKKSFQNIQCPEQDCKQTFNTDKTLKDILSESEKDQWWASAIEKNYISNRVHCPMKDCNAVFDAEENNTKQCTFTECYECHRGFCMACQAKWHPGEIKIFNDQEALKKTLDQAKKKNWSRCPKCFQLVEKNTGCSNIRCRCGTDFCYRCGGLMKIHNICTNMCHTFSESKLLDFRRPMFTDKTSSVPTIAKPIKI